MPLDTLTKKVAYSNSSIHYVFGKLNKMSMKIKILKEDIHEYENLDKHIKVENEKLRALGHKFSIRMKGISQNKKLIFRNKKLYKFEKKRCN